MKSLILHWIATVLLISVGARFMVTPVLLIWPPYLHEACGMNLMLKAPGPWSKFKETKPRHFNKQGIDHVVTHATNPHRLE